MRYIRFIVAVAFILSDPLFSAARFEILEEDPAQQLCEDAPADVKALWARRGELREAMISSLVRELISFRDREVDDGYDPVWQAKHLAQLNWRIEDVRAARMIYPPVPLRVGSLGAIRLWSVKLILGETSAVVDCDGEGEGLQYVLLENWPTAGYHNGSSLHGVLQLVRVDGTRESGTAGVFQETTFHATAFRIEDYMRSAPH